MKLIVTGSRNWTNGNHIYAALDVFSGDLRGDENLFLVHGACPTGADDIANGWAINHNPWRAVQVFRYPADWSRGKKAGPERNRRMIDDNLNADYVLAFPLGESRGTRHCMKYAASKGLTVVNLGER